MINLQKTNLELPGCSKLQNCRDDAWKKNNEKGDKGPNKLCDI